MKFYLVSGQNDKSEVQILWDGQSPKLLLHSRSTLMLFCCFIYLPTLFSLLTIIHDIWKMIQREHFKVLFCGSTKQCVPVFSSLTILDKVPDNVYIHIHIINSTSLSSHLVSLFMKTFKFI